MKQTKLKSSEVPADQDFTGVARTVEAYNNQGFPNFRIVTLHIEQGKVVRQDYSDPYANFEVVSRLEIANEMAIMNLNNNWANGKTLSR